MNITAIKPPGKFDAKRPPVPQSGCATRLGTILLALLLAVFTVHAQSLTTIKLRNQPAAEVIPIVEPLLQDGDVITGKGFVIFLRAAPQTVAQVREAIASLDSPAKMLQVSVYQGSTRDLERIDVDGSIRVERGGARVEVGSGRNDNRGNISIGTPGGSASIGGTRIREQSRHSPVHRVRVTEGRQAYIETGRRLPFIAGNVSSRKGTAGRVEFADATTGFYVLPRISGDRVFLEVSPFKNTAPNTGGGIDTSSAGTTITGRVGEWLQIGGADERIDRTRRDIGTHASTQGSSSESIWIRADVVR